MQDQQFNGWRRNFTITAFFFFGSCFKEKQKVFRKIP